MHHVPVPEVNFCGRGITRIPADLYTVHVNTIGCYSLRICAVARPPHICDWMSDSILLTVLHAYF